VEGNVVTKTTRIKTIPQKERERERK